MRAIGLDQPLSLGVTGHGNEHRRLEAWPTSLPVIFRNKYNVLLKSFADGHDEPPPGVA